MDDIFDVVIVGGGLVGLTLGIGLAHHNVRTAVVDVVDPKTAKGGAFDGRSSAIADASTNIFKALNIWHGLEAQAQPINDILVTDGRSSNRFRSGGASPFYLHFDPVEISDEGASVNPLGYIIENRHMREVLYDAAEDEVDRGCLALFAPDKAEKVVFHKDKVEVVLASEQALEASLCIAADGKFSRLRQQVGIKTVGRTYKQSGLVATVAHEYDHEGIAQEYFLPSGPFAILPMTGRRSSLVWTEKTDDAESLINLSEAEFLEALKCRFGSYLGEISVAGPRWCYPLSLVLAHEYIAPRLALVGDAAHGIHPIAGQGFNLGLRDVAALIEVVVDAKRVGLDPGTDNILVRYQRWRRFDSVVLGLVTDGLNQLFANDIGPIRMIRDMGLSVVNQLGPVRRLLMRHAAGHVGDRPKLLRGRVC